jgi:hypothetical protein
MVLCSCGICKNAVVLGDITWQYNGGVRSESVLIRANKIVLGPHNISLWGEYPYIAGDCVLPGPTTTYFVLDIRTEEVLYFKEYDQIREKYPIHFDYRDFVTFQDLKGQWEKPEKLESLLRNLKKQ